MRQVPAVAWDSMERFGQINPLQFRFHPQQAAGDPPVPYSAEQPADRQLFQDALARVGPDDRGRNL